MKQPITPPAPMFLDRAQFARSMSMLDVDGLVDLGDLLERFACLAALEHDAETEEEAEQRRLIVRDVLKERGFYAPADRTGTAVPA